MRLTKKINIVFLFVAIGMVFTSCEKDATDVKLPYIEPKIVVQSFISPQNNEIAIFVSTSVPVFGSKNQLDPTIPNANVTLSDGTTSVQAIFNSLKGYYITDSTQIKIVAGKTYYLNVTAADGRKAKASCTVPYPPDTSTVDFEYDTSYVKNGNSGQYDVKATLRWNDNPGQADFYHSVVQIGLSYTIDSTLERWESMYGGSYLDYYSDKGRDGKKLVNGPLVFTYYESMTGGPVTKTYEYAGMRYFLYRTDFNYYKYHETVSRSVNDPFSEPVIIYSNIEGGLGCFGAYNGYEWKINF